ncbi:thymidylate synthase-like [Planococcus citri]|uniref:thymidylate synthase-like n=1 Tax=Planococcus citri TaxID=170843 RepID=UPI0031F9D320
MMPISTEEKQYLDQIRKIIDEGIEKTDRTGVGTKSLIGCQMRYTLSDNKFPLLTTKRLFWKDIVEELLWFIKGCTNSNFKELPSIGVNMWNPNSTREYLDSLALTDKEEGDLALAYGFQWRHFGTKYKDMHIDYTYNQGIDQLQNVIDTLKKNSSNRKMILCTWNPLNLPKVALPPSLCLIQFYAVNGELSCQMYQRSADMGLGAPFDIACCSLLTCMIAHVTNHKPKEFIHTIGESHVYLDRIEPLKFQLEREMRTFPTLSIAREVNSISDFRFEDFVLDGYNPHKN